MGEDRNRKHIDENGKAQNSEKKKNMQGRLEASEGEMGNAPPKGIACKRGKQHTRKSKQGKT